MNNFIKIFLLFSSILLTSPVTDDGYLSSKDYFTDNDGVIRMNINIIGHVKNPGVFVVYDGIDILTALSLAGGYLNGSNLNKVQIYNQSGNSYFFNLKSLLYDKDSKSSNIFLKPHDTIFIEQKVMSKIFTSSNLPTLILSFLNIVLTISRTD